VPGPRILAAIQPVSGTGAYALTGFSPYVEVPHLSYEADGRDEIRKQVRRLVKEGANVIKLYLESYEKKQFRIAESRFCDEGREGIPRELGKVTATLF
jgi:hypothetical protein